MKFGICVILTSRLASVGLADIEPVTAVLY